ncbi:class I SAM-dependent methyltransferase [Legionella shakespearei]|uniref:3-demethylubiquinone-9 3-methyltransferase n=1 Tax=Legionella shakespearei DSM 23087 TaxID=1122169 RepID=A0A0W0YLK1_9GAMM|nr:class I SAM-dependent methyltransferase [Legionella shakespearei]KTD57707.1 3-demethylubiquinone-9 3-methyltransferase [Legionella shakespearei DSM 23087]
MECGIDLGLRDSMLNGWFNNESGELLSGFKISPDELILDIGCGGGHFSSFCAKHGAQIILADIDPDTISKAEERVRAAGPKSLRCLITNADPIPLENESVDKIIAMEVLEHVPKPGNFVAELFRVARPGAKILISVPGTQSENLQKKLAPESYFMPPNHIRIFQSNEIEFLLSSHGFIVEERINYGFYFSLWWSFFWTCNQDLSPPWHPLLQSWENTWSLLLDSKDGYKIKQALDDLLPKSQAFLAYKPE